MEEEREIGPLVIDQEFEERLSSILENRPFYRGIRPRDAFEQINDNRKLVHVDFLEELIRSLPGVSHSEDAIMVFRENHHFRIIIETGHVYVHLSADPEKYASICLEATCSGWSNVADGLTSFELTLLAKITAIAWDELPSQIQNQVENFILNERGGENLTLCYPSSNNHGILGLRDEMLRELERLRNIMQGGEGREQNRDRREQEVEADTAPPTPPPTSLRAELSRELRNLFQQRRERSINNNS